MPFSVKICRIFLYRSFTIAKREEYFVMMLPLVLLLYLCRSLKDVRVCFLENFVATVDLQSVLFLPCTIWAANVISRVIKSYVHQVFTLLSVHCILLEYFRNVCQCQMTVLQFIHLVCLYMQNFSVCWSNSLILVGFLPIAHITLNVMRAVGKKPTYILMSLDVHWHIWDQSCMLSHMRLGILVLASRLTQWTSIPDPYYA